MKRTFRSLQKVHFENISEGKGWEKPSWDNFTLWLDCWSYHSLLNAFLELSSSSTILIIYLKSTSGFRKWCLHIYIFSFDVPYFPPFEGAAPEALRWEFLGSQRGKQTFGCSLLFYDLFLSLSWTKKKKLCFFIPAFFWNIRIFWLCRKKN